MRAIGTILVGPDWPATSGRSLFHRPEPVQHAALRTCLVDQMNHRIAGLEPGMIPVEDWDTLLRGSTRRLRDIAAVPRALRRGVRLVADYVCRHRLFFDEPIYDTAIGVLADRP